MSRLYECRRKYCDGVTSEPGGLCRFHLSPIDEDLHRPRTEIPVFDPYYGPGAFSDDVAGMSSTEKYWHQENE